MALSSSTSFAEDSNFRLVTLNKSWHFTNENQNEKHNGFGLEYQYKEGLWLSAIAYKNSFNNQSVILSVNREYELKGFNVGWLAGAASGYDDYQAVAGVTTRYSYLRLIVTPKLVAVGLVVPIY